MNYYRIQSLEHIALVKISFMLWNQDDTRALIASISTMPFTFFSEAKKKDWQKVEERVTEKVPQLPLPMPLKEKVLCFIKPIGIELLKWLENCSENGYLCIKLMNEIFWTPMGTIDKKKTVETFVSNENNDVIIRLRMATAFYMMDDVKKLKKNSPEDYEKFLGIGEERQKLTNHLNNLFIRGRNIRSRVKLGLLPMHVCMKYMKLAATDGRREAVEYLWLKCPAEKRSICSTLIHVVADKSFQDTEDFPTQSYIDILGFLFLQVSEQRQERLFKDYLNLVLYSLLNWPWQIFLTDTVRRMKKHLPPNYLYHILTMINDKVEDGYKDYDYQQLFGEIWQQGSYAGKRYAIKELGVSGVLCKLFKNKDKRNIKLILEDLTPEDIKVIVSLAGMFICENMIRSDEWGLLTFFIQEFILSKNEMVQFKTTCKKNVATKKLYFKDDFQKEKWDKFFHLLDSFICEYDKRKCTEDDGNNPAKKCNTRSVSSDD